MAVDEAKLGKLFAMLIELHDKTGAIIGEIDAAMTGKAGIGSKLKEIEREFDRWWAHRYTHGATGTYVWNYKIDRANMKRLLMKLSVEEIVKRVSVYIADGDPFLVKNRHPFNFFVTRVNQYAAEGKAQEFDLEATVADCKHTPPCRSDQEHTRKKMADMRATR